MPFTSALVLAQATAPAMSSAQWMFIALILLLGAAFVAVLFRMKTTS